MTKVRKVFLPIVFFNAFICTSIGANVLLSIPAFESSKIELELREGDLLVFHRISGQLFSPSIDGFSWTGSTVDGASFLTVVKVKNFWRGSVITAQGSYKLEGAGGGISVFPDQKKVRACGGCKYTDLHVRDPRSYAQSIHSWRNSDAGLIDLMVIYPTAVKNAIGGEALTIAEIETAIADTNLCFRNSEVDLQLRLVHCAETSYTPTGNLGIDLDRLTEKNDGFLDDVHSLREQFGADIVTLLSTDSSSGGLAKTLTFPSLKFAESAFNVCVWDQITAPGYTLAHEIGHNLGCLHNREDVSDPDESAANDYGDFSYGKRWFIESAGYKTVMSYNDSSLSYQNSIPFFSNPLVTYLGVSTGNENSEDNALALNLSAPYASNFRSSVVQAILPSVFSLDVREGGYASFKLRLAVKPELALAINLSLSSDVNFQLGSASTITFDSSNWNTGVPVIVYGRKVESGTSSIATLSFSDSTIGSSVIELKLVENPSATQAINFHSGVVVNQYGFPIEGVEFLSSDSQVVMTSDQNGTFGKDMSQYVSNTFILKKDGYSFEPSTLVIAEEDEYLISHEFIGSRSSVVYVDQSATGRNNGTSWVDAFTNLSDALFLRAPVSQVWVARGTYFPDKVRSASFVMPGGIEVLGGFSGTEISTAERDPSLYPTILSGDIGISGFAKDNSFHVVIALDGAMIDGFIIEDGNASENFTNDSRGVGGGLWSEGAVFEVRNCQFRNNWAYQGGAGAWMEEGNATFTNCNFMTNKTGSTGSGGAMKAINSSIYLSVCDFAENYGFYGGGALHQEGGLLEVNNTKFSENVNSSWNGGGALFLKNVEGEMNLSSFIKNETYANNYGGAVKLINSSPLITQCLFSKNKSRSNSAGAIYIDENSAPKLSSNEFNENYAKSWGGAIYSETADLNVSGGSFYGNWATFGGAVATNGTQLTSFNSVKALGNEANATSGSQGGFLYLGNGTQANTFTNCLFSGNRSNYRHGVLAGAGTSKFLHCTFFGNEAEQLGAISLLFSGQSVRIDNSILWNNSDANGIEIDVNSGTVSIYHSVFDSDKTPWITASGNNLNADPEFINPAGEDGVVGTLDDDLSFTETSPVIDAGNTGLSNLPTFDLLGQMRDGNPDLGAFEYFENSLPVFTGELSFSVDEGNVTIGQALATDVDGHDLIYSIIGGNDQSEVLINSVTGVLSFSETTDYEYPNDSNLDNKYEIKVRVSDGFSNVQADYEIIVTDLDESATSSDQATFLINGFPVSYGWKDASWFGTYYAEFFPWVYHESLGWLYIIQQKNTQVWMWQSSQGWLWTTPQLFPFYYQSEKMRWAYSGSGDFMGMYYLFGEPDPGWKILEKFI